jgi:multimeric flavodoxin WrbA
MREHGWARDEWPELYPAVKEADIVVVTGPIWLGDNSSQTRKLIERLYAHSGELNEEGLWAFYGKALPEAWQAGTRFDFENPEYR